MEAGAYDGALTPWEIYIGAVCSRRTAPMEKTHIGAVHEELWPMGRIHSV